MFDAGRWALLPDDAIVQRYSQCLEEGIGAPSSSRDKFPVIEVAIHLASVAIVIA
jgi:hypothetical protein